MKTKEEINAAIKALQQEREQLCVQKKPIEERLNKIFNQLERLQKQLGDVLLVEGKAKDLRWLLQNDNRHLNTKLYKILQNWMMPYGLFLSGTHPDTKQARFSILLSRSGSNIEKIRAGIELLLSKYKPFKQKWVTFDILEHTCSEYKASPDFHVWPDGSKAMIVYHGCFDEVVCEGTITECLVYMKANDLWYKED